MPAIYHTKIRARAARSGRGVMDRPEKPKLAEARISYDLPGLRQGPQHCSFYLLRAFTARYEVGRWEVEGRLRHLPDTRFRLQGTHGCGQ